jgi:hypothetical protein
MTDASPRSCDARVVVIDDQVRWLDSRPYAAHQVNAFPYCALEAGHPGPHSALGQRGDGVEWWLRWTRDALADAGAGRRPEVAEIVETHICPAESETIINAHGEPDICLLYEGHPGRHSFELD